MCIGDRDGGNREVCFGAGEEGAAEVDQAAIIHHVGDDACAGDVCTIETLLQGDVMNFVVLALVVADDAGLPNFIGRNLEECGVGAIHVESGVLHDFADEGVAVGMHAVGGEPQHDVAGLDAHRVDGACEFNHADGEAGKIEIITGVDAGHLGGLAAEERAAGLSTPLGDALEQVAEHGLVDLADGDVIEEEERFGALHDHVVDIHRDQVDADGVVLPHRGGDLDLGAAAVGAGDEDRVLVVACEELFVEVEAEGQIAQQISCLLALQVNKQHIMMSSAILKG